MDWYNNKERIRNFLRDPNALIWSESLVKRLWNNAQRSFQLNTNLLEDVEAIKIPPSFNASYMFDWEWRYFNNAEGFNYKCFKTPEQTGTCLIYNFEIEIDYEVSAATDDYGHHFTHPWEAFISGVIPGDVVPMYFPSTYSKGLMVAYDRRPIESISLKEIQENYSDWNTHTGSPDYYYKLNSVDNTFALFPTPNSVEWDDYITTFYEYAYLYFYDWEGTGYATGESYKFTHTWEATDPNNNIEYIFDWEQEHLDGGECRDDDEATMHGMYSFEGGDSSDEGYYNIISHNIDDYGTSIGTIRDRTNSLEAVNSSGVMVEFVDLNDNVCLVFKAMPTDIENDEDTSDWPQFILKYINYGMLELAFSVNNDGRSESLRDYWAYRREIGTRMIQLFKGKRKQDRNYRLITPYLPSSLSKKLPRLPSTYPNI